MWDNNKQENHLKTLYNSYNSNNFETKCTKKEHIFFFLSQESDVAP